MMEQIAKIFVERRDHYDNTERISLVSSFVVSMLAGTYAPIDFADGLVGGGAGGGGAAAAVVLLFVLLLLLLLFLLLFVLLFVLLLFFSFFLFFFVSFLFCVFIGQVRHESSRHLLKALASACTRCMRITARRQTRTASISNDSHCLSSFISVSYGCAGKHCLVFC
jgi:hypothetical protein